MKILIVDDEEMIRGVLKEYVEFEGNEAFEASDGMEAVRMCKDNDYDVVLMDVMMPRLDGFSAVKEIRKFKDVPVIMLSARGEEYDKLFGFEIGADDYVTKPFVPMELLARVHSHLRRYEKFLRATGAAAAPTLRTYVIGGLELCEDTAELTVDGTPVKLTPLEFKILALLMKNPGRVFSAEEIYERVWNERAVSTDTIMVHIRNIREKIEYNPREPKYLKVVWGIGYKIEK